jgi:DNA-binding transcriptional MocR family regulator
MRAFAVDRASSLPLIRQIYQEISAQILSGEMAARERLLSTREAAGELGVSRNVVIEAYEQLAAEGFLIGVEGAGTFVAEGIRVELLPRGGRPELAFVTPSHQFPLGGCLSIQRRIALVEWARSCGCLLVEDDYESEFRYDVGPVSALQRLDPDNVAYVGTFSKVFFPALHLGYLVLPFRLVAPAIERKRLRERYQPPAAQLAMARFIEEGRLDRHIARMRKAYRGRRDALSDALEAAFPGRLRMLGRATGLHLAASFDGIDFGPDLVEALARGGGDIERGGAALARGLAGK